MRLILTAAAALSLAACGAPDSAEVAPADAPATSDPAPSAPTPTVADDVLTAQGLGPARIGMTRAELIAVWGEDASPNAVGGPDPEDCDEFRPTGAPEGTLVMVENGRLARISLVRASALQTEAGFGIGDTAASLKQALGDRARVEPHKYVDAPAEYITVWSAGADGGEAYVQNPEARGFRYEIGAEGVVTAVRAGGPSIQYVEGCS